VDELTYLGRDGETIRSVPLGKYPSGEPLVAWSGFGPPRVLVRATTPDVLMSALFWIDALGERTGTPPPELVLPFIPGARQDRLNDSGDFLFTAKSVAREISARKFPRVIVVDPHSDVAPALIDRCHVIHADSCVSPPAGKYAAVISPDGGAEKRAGRVARKLGVPLLHAWKTRDVTDGKISGFGCEPLTLPPSSRVLVVDDICDGGGTFVGLADAMTLQTAQSGPRVKRDLYVTHGLFTKGTADLLSRFDHVYCTDSVNADRPGVIEVKVCEGLLKEGTIR